MVVSADEPCVDTGCQGRGKRSDGFLAALNGLWKTSACRELWLLSHSGNSGPLQLLQCSSIHVPSFPALQYFAQNSAAAHDSWRGIPQGIPLPLNSQALMTSTSPKKILRSAKIVLYCKRSWESEVFRESY